MGMKRHQSSRNRSGTDSHSSDQQQHSAKRRKAAHSSSTDKSSKDNDNKRQESMNSAQWAKQLSHGGSSTYNKSNKNNKEKPEKNRKYDGTTVKNAVIRPKENKPAPTTKAATTTTTTTTTTTAAPPNNKAPTILPPTTISLPPLQQPLSFDAKYIVAPMVGASELPFRLFCRKYGAQLCYTPMMMAKEFATSAQYRQREFPTSPLDRPLVCHFAANTPADFAAAAQQAAPYCDAIDLNLGCPQRTAYVGHFGSYLLDPQERTLICDMVRAASTAVSIPIFVKIRLLDTYDETHQLVAQLYQAGATLIAVHARFRANFDRKGPGARDGPALLDQVAQLKAAFPNRYLIANGNTITYDDVVKNIQDTHADGLMSAEGILDNPALFLPRYGTEEDAVGGIRIPIRGGDPDFFQKREQEGKKLFQKLAKIQKIELKQDCQKVKLAAGVILHDLPPKQAKKVAKKSKIIAKLAQLDESILATATAAAAAAAASDDPLTTAQVALKQLYDTARDKTLLALEYLQWAHHYPTTMRTVIFHTRRILKVELATYQCMEECLGCRSVEQVRALVHKIRGYQADPASFQFDKLKAKQDKEALERKKQEEGKRKAYEARMIRKAKREGKTGPDLEFYLRQGAVVPTAETVQELLTLMDDKPKQLQIWKDRDHSQHCVGFHLNGGICPRGRSCAFLHVASTTANTFDESDEVAG